jgi:hypothetical protein
VDDLATLQRRFFALVTAREEITGALTRHGLTQADAAAFVRGDERLDPVGRLGIYNDMYFFRLLGALEEDFPLLATALGKDAFRALVADYLDAVVPAQALRDLGAGLPAFLARHQPARDRPWLRDLAALEWAKADVLDRADAVALTVADLQALAPDAFAALTLGPVPSASFLDLAYPLDELITALERPTTEPTHATGPPNLPEPTMAPSRVLVWRVGALGHHRLATPDEAPLLPRLFATPPPKPPPTFAEICELVGRDHSVETAAPVAFRVLVGWLQIGLIRRA